MKINSDDRKIMSLLELNWHKGLFRLWLFASFIWIASFEILTDRARHELNEARQILSMKTDSVSKDNEEQTIPKEIADSMAELREVIMKHDAKEQAVRAEQKLLFYSIITVVPPVVVLILVFALMWVLQGFSRNESK